MYSIAAETACSNSRLFAHEVLASIAIDCSKELHVEVVVLYTVPIIGRVSFQSK